MISKRIIPCLDVKDGRTVKGINFINIKDAGDPVEMALNYSDQGADELVFLDITATHEKRKTLTELAGRVAAQLNIVLNYRWQQSIRRFIEIRYPVFTFHL